MIRISTKGMTREEWLKLRRTGIGGSDAGAICGLNPYSSPMTVYRDKTGDYLEDEDNESMRQGRDLEDYVARRFCEETGLRYAAHTRCTEARSIRLCWPMWIG